MRESVRLFDALVRIKPYRSPSPAVAMLGKVTVTDPPLVSTMKSVALSVSATTVKSALLFDKVPNNPEPADTAAAAALAEAELALDDALLADVAALLSLVAALLALVDAALAEALAAAALAAAAAA